MQMCPDFNPSLSWQLGDEGILCTLLPLGEQTLSEIDQVRHVAKAFYRFATGIEPGQLKGNVPALLRWSKFGGEELSRIVDRCLAPNGSKESITTLTGLNNALGRFKANNLPQGASNRPSTPPSSVTGQGLDKVAGMRVLKDLLRREVVAPIRNPEPIGSTAFPSQTAFYFTDRQVVARLTSHDSLLRNWATISLKSSPQS